jgi:ABC-type glutathione transport system ATPase component
MLQQVAVAGGLAAAERSVPPLVADGVRKVYDDGWRQVPVIADLSFRLEASTIVSVVGPSGCGKTTLLNVLSGLIRLRIDHLVRPAIAGHAAQGRLHAAERSPVPVADGTR